MNKTLLFILSILLFISCKTQKRATVELKESEVMDSVIITKKKKASGKVDDQLFKSIVQPDVYSVSEVANLKIHDSEFEKVFKNSLNLFYKENNHEPKWLSSTGPQPIAFTLLSQFKSANLNGLDSTDFQLSRMYNILQSIPDDRLELERDDIFITCNALLYIIQLKLGIDIENIYRKRNEIRGMVEGLAKVQNSEELESFIRQLEPDFPEYKKLKVALKNYLEYQTELDQDYYLVATDPIEPGDYSKQIPEIRERLLITEPVENYQPDDKYTYDEKLKSAVKFFQMRHGLETDGIVDKETIQHLNKPIEDQIEKIKANLNRMKDPVYSKDERHIKITIPECMLKIYDDHEVELSMKVIVGKEDWATPLFEDTLQYIVFSPTWTVPKTIAIKEMLGKLKSNPFYYDTAEYKFYHGWHGDSTVNPSKVNWSDYDEENFPFKIVQQPGPKNALGRVKFIMPNSHYVYLHDTPADYLFNKKDRSLSHGCIRVEKPVDLACYLLDDKNYDRVKALEKMSQDEPEKVYLPESLPVDIVYRTAWVDENGFINFREDIYNQKPTELYEFKEEIN